MSKLVCPKCGNNRFAVTAHVTETWEVNEHADFVDIIRTDEETVTHRPVLGGGYFFTCRECDTEAVEVQ